METGDGVGIRADSARRRAAIVPRGGGEAVRQVGQALVEAPQGRLLEQQAQEEGRGQEGEDYWFDTLGCTLFPTAPLYIERNRVMATYVSMGLTPPTAAAAGEPPRIVRAP